MHGDALSLTIAAASIIAKTTRDAMMTAYDARVPRLRLRPPQGLPDGGALRGARALGACPLHRRSFAPVRQALGLEPVQQELFPAAAAR